MIQGNAAESLYSCIHSNNQIIERKEYWQEEVEILKAIIAKTELVETTIWGGPAYTFNRQNVVSAGGFSNTSKKPSKTNCKNWQQ